jgi:glycosyltransferase involved in cell wall biosynthesis
LKFSLILATVDRTVEPERFLKKLGEQSYRDFEVIVVDQNIDGCLDYMVERFRNYFRVVHLKSARRGVSVARNLGLQRAEGEIVAFPDDDCWYRAELLEQVRHLFDEMPDWDGVSGRGVEDRAGKGPPLRWPGKPARLNRFNMWRMADCYTIFLRRRAVEWVGGFNEALGPGSGTPWGSGEPADYVLRMLAAGFEIHYNPQIEVHHPQVVTEYGQKALAKAYAYALGEGRVFSMHRYPVWWLVYRCLRTLGSTALALASGRVDEATYHWKVFEGRLRGWNNPGRV